MKSWDGLNRVGLGMRKPVFALLWCTMGYCVVLWGYCMALLVTAGYFWVLGGTRGLLGGTGVH